MKYLQFEGIVFGELLCNFVSRTSIRTASVPSAGPLIFFESVTSFKFLFGGSFAELVP